MIKRFQNISFLQFFLAINIFLFTLYPNQEVFCQGLGQVYGSITDEQGRPVPYANIVVKGTTLGIAANEFGKYKLMVPPADTITIEFSSIGYANFSVAASIHSGEKKQLNVTLQSAQSQLEEVSVLAYQRRLLLLVVGKMVCP